MTKRFGDPQEIGDADHAMHRGTGPSRRGSLQHRSSRLRVRLALAEQLRALRDAGRGVGATSLINVNQ